MGSGKQAGAGLPWIYETTSVREGKEKEKEATARGFPVNYLRNDEQ